MKMTFLCVLWSWVNLYSVDNIDSLIDELEGFLGSLLYASRVLFGSLLLFFLSIYCFFPIKKKNEKKA